MIKLKNVINHALFALIIGILLTANAFAQTRGWGNNGEGQLGIGNTMNQPTPLTVLAVPDVVGIGGGYKHTIFLMADGTLVAAGWNGWGQLGDGTTGNKTSPVSISPLTNFIQAAGGGEHSAALLSDGTVLSWGNNSSGQIGNGTTGVSGCFCVPFPVQSSITDVVQLEAGYGHTLAVKADGTVWAWGANTDGQIGDNSQMDRPTPVQVGVGVAGFTNIVAVSAGEFHSMALKSDGTVWVWGNNGNGQVGNNSTTPANQLVPVQNTTLSNVVAISAGAFHNITLLRDGTVRVWGRNSEGQVGNGSASGNQLVPVQTSGITNVVEIEAGGGYTNVVRLSDGSVRAWGYNGEGEVGNGTTLTSGCFCQSTPVTTSVGTGNAAIGNGYFHGFALKPSVALSAFSSKVVRGDNLSVVFSNITGVGNFSYTAVDPSALGALTVPPGYTVQTNQSAYDLTNTAPTSGNINVCIKVNEPNPSNYPLLKVLHEEGMNLVDRTTSYSAAAGNVCATVTSFSRFVVAQGLVPTAAGVSIGGRVQTLNGTGIKNAVVILSTLNGETIQTRTSSFGYYHFDNIEAGQTVIISVLTKRFNFLPQVISVNDNLTDLNFVAVNENLNFSTEMRKLK